MIQNLKKLFIDQPIILIFFGLLAVILILAYVTFQIGGAYQQRTNVEQPVVQELGERKTRVKKITLRRRDENGETCLVVSHNGEFTQIDCVTGEVLKRGVLSQGEISSLFGQLENGEFESLALSYAGSASYTLTIETTNGTKTITITEGGSGGLPSIIEELIEEIEEQEENLFTPPPVASPTPDPGSTPTPVPTATPTPLATAQPSPTPLPPGVTPEPFSCNMLSAHSKSIVVSNMVCLP